MGQPGSAEESVPAARDMTPSASPVSIRDSGAVAKPAVRADAQVSAATGTLVVSGTHAGRIYVNHKLVGTTPRSELELPVGTHSVNVFFLHRSAFSRKQTAIVHKGKTTSLHFVAKPITPRPARKVIRPPHTSKTRAAVALYNRRQWAQAFNTIKDHAASQTGARRRQAEVLADAIRVVARSWIRGERATKPAEAVKYYQAALTADRKIGRGHHQRELMKRIFNAAKRQATNSLAKKRHASAYSGYKLAKKFGPEDAVLRRVMQSLERKAQDYFTKGYDKRNTNIAYARKLWQHVLRMVPPTNRSYRKAYQYLNSSAPPLRDNADDWD